MRGEDLGRLPIATLVGPPRHDTRPHGSRGIADADDGPTTDELVADAYQQGFTEGIAASDAAVRNDVTRALAAIQAATATLDHAASTWEQSGPEEALELALQLAEVILMREVACSDAPGREAILRCFSEIDRGERAVVRLHPSDLETLGSVDDLMVDRSFELVADPSVAPGDAVADTPHGSIDARLASSLERVKRELLS
jgi:flagellar assembly protein FliH